MKNWTHKLISCVCFTLGVAVSAFPCCAEEGKEEVTLTIPLFFENRIPDNISDVEEAVDALTYEKIGVNIQLIPMLRLVGTDTLRISEMNMIKRAGNSFDIVHASMPDIEMIDLTDLLPEYGSGIVELFQKNGQDLFDGRRLNALPSYSDYVGGQGIAMRKDLVEKYGIDLSALKTYDDFDALFAQIASQEPDMKMICSYSTGRGLLYRYGCNNFNGTVFCVTPGDDTSVSNWYATEEYEHWVKLFRSWYEKGYIYEYSALQDIPASELVRAGELFSFVCAYKPGIDLETSSSCGMEMVVVQTRPAVITNESLSRGCWGISAYCQHPEEAMQFLNLLYTDEELVNLLSNGIAGIHYDKSEDGTIFPLPYEGTKNAEFLNDASWILPNQFLGDVRTGDDPMLWEKLHSYNLSAVNAPNLGFVFDDSEVEEERHSLNSIAAKYAYGLESGQLDPDIYLKEMLQKMEKAGEDKVYQELSEQFTEWCASQGEEQ
ncbi:MAG: ABC transporter substrate-binding protein [Lachnospiraceae bacterium]|nr:ABC transporter substrate-binding protein [Robinsoniella sp.]MDY3767592.1 ABC transporter substrate-binding protein [Lachnospiraceae bacterium]